MKVSRRLARQVLRLNEQGLVQAVYRTKFKTQFGFGTSAANVVRHELLVLWKLAREQRTFTLKELRLMKEINK